MTDVFAAIEALDDDFGYWIWTKHVADPAGVADALGRLGLEVPADYAAFVRAHGCAAIQAKEEAWPRPAPYAVGPLWAHAYGIEIFGVAADTPPPLDVRRHRAQVVKAGVSDLVPLAALMGRGDLLCVDASGALCWSYRGERTPIPGTFTEVITGVLRQLAADKDRAKAAGPKLWT